MYSMNEKVYCGRKRMSGIDEIKEYNFLMNNSLGGNGKMAKFLKNEKI